MSKANLTLNGMTVEFQPGQTILEVAGGTESTPFTLCYLKDTHGHGFVSHVHGGSGRGPDLLPACAPWPIRDGDQDRVARVDASRKMSWN